MVRNEVLDSNIVIYDQIKTERRLDNRTQQIKSLSHEIMERISKGERVVTSTVHVSETANILEEVVGIENSYAPISELLKAENIQIESVDRSIYATSLDEAKEHNIGVNDGLAVVVMKNLGIDEIYSFDEHFDKIEGIRRVEK